MVSFQYQNGGYKKEGGSLVSRFCCNRKGRNGFKIREEILIACKRQVLYEKSGEGCPEKWWIRLSLKTFKVRLEEALINLI